MSWLDLAAPFWERAQESRQISCWGSSFTVSKSPQGDRNLTVPGIGRDQDEPQDEELSKRISAIDGFEPVWGTAWKFADLEPLRALAAEGGEVTRRSIQVQSIEDARELWEAASMASLDVFAIWTWERLQVKAETQWRQTEWLVLGWDFMARGDQRHETWETFASDRSFERDSRFPEKGQRLLVPPDDVPGLGRDIFELEPTGFQWLSVNLRPKRD